MKKLIIMLLSAVPLVFSVAPFAPRAEAQRSNGYIIIINKQNSVTELKKTFVADVFLKKTTRWPNGKTVLPVDAKIRSNVRGLFSEAIIGRSQTQVRNYWTQQIFSGTAIPPPELASDEAVVAWVAKKTGAIGYVSIYADTSLVKAVNSIR